MGDMVDRVVRYRKEYPELRCTTVIFKTVMDEYKIEYTELDMSVMLSLAGGLGIQEICGIYLAGLAVLNVLIDYYHSDCSFRMISLEYMYSLKEILGETKCPLLLTKYASLNDKCDKIIVDAVFVIEDISKKILRKKGI